MTMASPRVWLSGFVLLITAGPFLLFCRQGLRIQAAPGDDVAKDQQRLTPIYFGVDTCIDCHSEGTKRKPVLCRCTEVAIWKDKDKHTQANELLKDKRGQEIGKALGIKDVTTDKKCVTCHGVYVEDEKQKDPSFKLSDGVSCVACHGAYKDWLMPHAPFLEGDRQKWRAHSREYKETHYGMTDLWDPAKRAKLCLSCHVGNTQQGKVVTHAMYAAGHPPLPGVELATFSDEMPRHWEYLIEKEPVIQALLNVKKGEPEVEQTKLVLVSGLSAFKQSMQLLATQAAAGAEATDDERAWPELAQFDCYACHHELKTPGWRQTRGYKGKPGRPTLHSWPLQLVKVGLRQLGEGEEALSEQLKPLQEQFNATPFGKPREVSAAANKVVTWADAQLPKLKDLKLDHGSALAVLRDLCTLPAEELPDYDSARQIAWAARSIYRELYDWGDPREHVNLKGKKPKLPNNQEILARLDALDKQLKLQLPAGKTQTIVAQLSDSMKKLGDYDPFAFKETLKQLLDLLPTK